MSPHIPTSAGGLPLLVRPQAPPHSAQPFEVAAPADPQVMPCPTCAGPPAGAGATGRVYGIAAPLAPTAPAGPAPTPTPTGPARVPYGPSSGGT